MRPVTALALGAVLLAACSSSGTAQRAEREYRRIPATLDAAPAGVRPANGGPACVETEVTGGGLKGARYYLRLVLADEHGYLLHLPPARPKVFYAVEVEAAGRVFTGRVSNVPPRKVASDSLYYAQPEPLGELRTGDVQPEQQVGEQQVPADVTACRLSIAVPTEQEPYGRILGESDGAAVIVDPDGNVRPAGEK